MEQKPYPAFTGLEVWKKARKLKIELEGLVKPFLPAETYGLSNQQIWAARSNPANLAEGRGCYPFKGQLHCIQAKAWLREVPNHLCDPLACNSKIQVQVPRCRTK